MDVRVTVLSDNIVSTKGLLAEHGLSILLEADGKQLLFDVGQGLAVIHNAQVLGITFHSPPIVLSHGHYDHTGGLVPFSRVFPRTTVFAHPDVFERRFSVAGANSVRDIGAPFAKEELERDGVAVNVSDKPHEVLDGVWTTGQIARSCASDQATTGLSLDAAGQVRDNVLDEIAVVIEGAERTLLLLGCAHAGIRNTIQQAQLMTKKPFYGIVGGLHLAGARPSEVRALASFLHKLGLEFVAASHCTGCKAANILGNYVECTLTAVGTRLKFEL